MSSEYQKLAREFGRNVLVLEQPRAVKGFAGI